MNVVVAFVSHSPAAVAAAPTGGRAQPYMMASILYAAPLMTTYMTTTEAKKKAAAAKKPIHWRRPSDFFDFGDEYDKLYGEDGTRASPARRSSWSPRA